MILSFFHKKKFKNNCLNKTKVVKKVKNNYNNRRLVIYLSYINFYIKLNVS